MSQPHKPANKELEGIDGLTEEGYLPMPLILCRTTRPHSLSRPKAVSMRDQIKHMLAAIKNWLR